MFDKFKKLRNAYLKIVEEKTPEVGIIEIDEKTSRTIGIGQEFNYAVAASVLGAQGIPQPKRLQTYQDYVNLYGASTWVYACVYQIAVSIAGVPLLLYKKPTSKKSRLERIDDPVHPLIKVINRPNMYMSEFDFKEAVVANLELTGNSYIEEVKSGRTPIELYPLQSQRMKIIPGKDVPIQGYRYEDQGRFAIFKEDEITHIKYHNPISDFYGASPLTAPEIATKTDVQSAKYNRNFFDNAARPDAVLETEQGLAEKMIRRLKTQWRSLYGGVGKAHGIAILEGGLKYKQIALSQKDMDFIQGRKMNREEIFAAFGVHPALFGLVERINNSIMQNIRRNFWENTLVPKMEKIKSSLNYNLVLPFGDDLVLMFDMDSIESLKESRETRAKIAAILVDRGLMTINEVRKQSFNLDDVPWGDVWYMPMNLIPVDKAGAGLPPGKPIGRQPVGGESVYSSIIDENGEIKLLDYYPDKSAEEEIKVEKEADINPFPPIDTKDKKQRELRKKAFEGVHGKFEEKFIKVLRSLFTAQSKQIIAAVRGGKKIKDLLRIIDADKKKFRTVAEDFYQGVIKVAGNSAMEELKELVGKKKKAKEEITFDFDIFDSEVMQFVDERSYDFWESISTTTKKNLQLALSEAVSEGLTTNQIVERLMDKVFNELTLGTDLARARLIARTEITILLNQGAFQAYKQSGVKMKKSWLTSQDEDVRNTHKAAEAEGIIPTDAVFKSTNMKHPGDPSGHVKELANCRCSLLPEVETKPKR